MGSGESLSSWPDKRGSGLGTLQRLLPCQLPFSATPGVARATALPAGGRRRSTLPAPLYLVSVQALSVACLWDDLGGKQGLAVALATLEDNSKGAFAQRMPRHCVFFCVLWGLRRGPVGETGAEEGALPEVLGLRLG